MELQDYIRILHKNWVLITVVFVASVTLAFTLTAVTPPTYTTSAKVFVSTAGASSASELQQSNAFTVERVATYADLATTESVLSPTIEALELAGVAVSDLQGRVSASAPTNKSVIDITVTDEDPARATAVANEAARQLSLVVEELETTDATDGSPVRLSIVQTAHEPSTPSAPNTRLNLLVGAIVGLMLGLALAWLRSALDSRIHNEKDVERLTDIPILGGIVFDTKAKERPLVVHSDPLSPRSESFRTLRTNLQFVEAGRTTKAFVVTSSVPSEGKSTTVSNLAIAHAQSGKKVLLVDADLRRPKVHHYLGVEGGVGLSDAIIGRVDVADAIQAWGDSGLHILAAGQIPPNPSELLGSEGMEKLISALSESFDVILFDAPPLLPVTDAAVLARLVGGSILIVAAGRTRAPELEASMEALQVVGAPCSGVVLTMLPTSGPDSYGYGRYGYHYAEPESGSKEGRSRKDASAADQPEEAGAQDADAEAAERGTDAEFQPEPEPAKKSRFRLPAIRKVAADDDADLTLDVDPEAVSADEAEAAARHEAGRAAAGDEATSEPTAPKKTKKSAPPRLRREDEQTNVLEDDTDLSDVPELEPTSADEPAEPREDEPAELVDDEPADDAPSAATTDDSADDEDEPTRAEEHAKQR